MKGRIWFEGNPWPAGHAVKELSMKGRIEDDGLRLDLSLVSSDYDAESKGAPGTGDWGSPIVWGNYHAAKIEPNLGLHVASKKRPLVLDASGAFHVSDDAEPPEEWDDFAMHVYLLGHDAIAMHEIDVRPNGDRFDLTWRAKLALAYSGDYEHKYAMRAEITDVGFDGFVAAIDDARTRWPKLVADPSRFSYDDGVLRFARA